jgi:hypothetical protein
VLREKEKDGSISMERSQTTEEVIKARAVICRDLK